MDVAIEALGRAATFETAVESVVDGGKAVMVGIAPVGEKAGVEVTRVVRRNVSGMLVPRLCVYSTVLHATRGAGCTPDSRT